MSKRNGYTLIELLIIVAIIGLVAGITLPNFAKMRNRMALRAAAGELRSIFHLVRMRAITTGSHNGVKFLQIAGVWHFILYEDGDRDGVRNDDIKSGVDRPLSPPRVVLREARNITIGLIEIPVKDADGDLVKSPVVFNNSTICSFSPIGQSTPGTIYITDGDGDLWCVRVYGASAKIRTLRYDPRTRKWIA
ncbi:MAG TPA: prepilin-type N-terminal cleavage/methylation domain-containing protein [Thermoanaerobaculia bacterium]|nr:prepilin-type N-terminal cleavage/methylation domain-containing protein [Thermoanaerobaculia bacterium]